MGSTNRQTQGAEHGPTRVSLKIWHPECWTLQVTDGADAGLIAHGVYQVDGTVSARMTGYADQRAVVNQLMASIRESSLTTAVDRVRNHFTPYATEAAGNATQEILVKYKEKNSIHKAFVSRGFVPDEPIKMEGGYEYWTVVSDISREEIQRRIEQIRQAENASVTVQEMESAVTGTQAHVPANDGSILSERQREVYALAKQNGYYTWPRETSASELADQLNISKTTLLEHLRKAEAKMIGTE